MINFDNMKTFETTTAVAEGHTILVSFTSNRGGYTSRTYRDVTHAIEGIAAMEASPMCGSMWTATKASLIKYRCPTWEEVTSNGLWSCD